MKVLQEDVAINYENQGLISNQEFNRLYLSLPYFLLYEFASIEENLAFDSPFCGHKEVNLTTRTKSYTMDGPGFQEVVENFKDFISPTHKVSYSDISGQELGFYQKVSEKPLNNSLESPLKNPYDFFGRVYLSYENGRNHPILIFYRGAPDAMYILRIQELINKLLKGELPAIP